MTLHDSIEKLTREHKTTAHTVDGLEFHTQDGLLNQLREAVFGGMESTGGGSGTKSRPPIDAGAFDLYTLIDRQVSEAWVAVHNIPPNADRPERLAAEWAALVQDDAIVTVTHPEQHERDGQPFVVHARAEYQAWQLAARWVNQITEFFDPPRHAEIDAPCPRCEQRWVEKRKDGETVRASALTFVRDRQTGETLRAECVACGSLWPPDQFTFLSAALGVDVVELAEETAERVPTVRLSEACENGKHERCESLGCRCEHHDMRPDREKPTEPTARVFDQRHTLMAESSAPLNPITRAVCGTCFTETSITGDCLCFT